jgi:hypothetical protein
MENGPVKRLSMGDYCGEQVVNGRRSDRISKEVQSRQGVEVAKSWTQRQKSYHSMCRGLINVIA